MCSSKSGENLTSLDQYISRMKPGQKQIYYITGQDKKQLEQSPFLEKLLKKGYEVSSLFLHSMTNISLRFLGCSLMPSLYPTGTCTSSLSVLINMFMRRLSF